MNELTDESAERAHARSMEGVTVLDGEEADALKRGIAPLKVVTGTQTTSSLSFTLQPGAIVAYRGAKVIFVCG